MEQYKIIKRYFYKGAWNASVFTKEIVVATFNVENEEEMHNAIDFFHKLIPFSGEVYDTSRCRENKFVGYWLYKEGREDSLNAIYRVVKDNE